jgi:hypothetical protein
MSVLSLRPSASCRLPFASDMQLRVQLHPSTGWPAAVSAFVSMPGKTGVGGSARKAGGPKLDVFCS